MVNVPGASQEKLEPMLLRESIRQLLMYLLDKRVSLSILLLTFMSGNAYRELLTFVLNYLIDYLNITYEITHNYFITEKK